jgi:hypothetical protein
MTEPPREHRPDRPDEDRHARLGAALRANLARRKAQRRARAGDTAGPAPTDTDNGQGRE